MNTPEERMWTRVADASRPNAAEMAAAEAELRALDDAEPLPVNLVDSVLERATAPQAAPVAVAVGPAPRSWRRVLLMAALLFVSVSAIAWRVLDRAWKEGASITPDSKLSVTQDMDYAEAVALATEPDRTPGARMNSINQISEHCHWVADVLGILAQGGDSSLATEATRIRKVLASHIASGNPSRPTKVDPSFRDLVSATLEEARSPESRLAALLQVERQAAAGLSALMLAAPFFDGTAKQTYDVFVSELVRAFSK